MIVTRLWTTHKKGKWNSFYFEGHYYSEVEKHWEGIFLFGIIPIFIKQVKTIYSR